MILAWASPFNWSLLISYILNVNQFVSTNFINNINYWFIMIFFILLLQMFISLKTKLE